MAWLAGRGTDKTNGSTPQTRCTPYPQRRSLSASSRAAAPVALRRTGRSRRRSSRRGGRTCADRCPPSRGRSRGRSRVGSAAGLFFGGEVSRLRDSSAAGAADSRSAGIGRLLFFAGRAGRLRRPAPSRSDTTRPVGCQYGTKGSHLELCLGDTGGFKLFASS